jgi:aerobic-type carbon monoxide dehydrogenase small subunit (CoxS/CutS family)
MRIAATVPIELTLNGERRTTDVAPHHTLLDVLRDQLGLTGAKECCLVGECGACTVRLDGRIVDSCLVLAVEADGGEVQTVEGLAVGGGLTRLQRAFLEHGAVQCGFCIPGQLMAADDLLTRVPHPSRVEIEEGLAGNLCRCGCYVQIMDAVEAAARDATEVAVPAASFTPADVPSPPVDQ